MVSLQAEDGFAIEQLYARYSFVFDDGDGEGCAALFTPEGSFVQDDWAPVTGRTAIREWVDARYADNPGVQHYTTNLVLDPMADHVRARSFTLVLRTPPEGGLSFRNAGRYEDEIVRHGDGWCFRRRAFSSCYAGGPSDLSFVFGPTTRAN